MLSCQLKINNKKTSKKLAKFMVKILKKPFIICLIGDLGAGKTFFASALIKNLNPSIKTVTSPTFNLVNMYYTNNFNIWHFDLYRLVNEDEVLELGLDEALNNNLTIIEWANKLKTNYPKDAININITISENNVRIFHISCEKEDFILALKNEFKNECL